MITQRYEYEPQEIADWGHSHDHVKIVGTLGDEEVPESLAGWHQA